MSATPNTIAIVDKNKSAEKKTHHESMPKLNILYAFELDLHTKLMNQYVAYNEIISCLPKPVEEIVQVGKAAIEQGPVKTVLCGVGEELKVKKEKIQAAENFMALVADLRKEKDDNKKKEQIEARMARIANLITFLFQHIILHTKDVREKNKKGIGDLSEFFVEAIKYELNSKNYQIENMKMALLSEDLILVVIRKGLLNTQNPIYKNTEWKARKIYFRDKKFYIIALMRNLFYYNTKTQTLYCRTDSDTLLFSLPPAYTFEDDTHHLRSIQRKDFSPPQSLFQLKIIKCTDTNSIIGTSTAEQMREDKLKDAAARGNDERVLSLIREQGVDINGRGARKLHSDKTALILAAQNTKKTVVKILLEQIQLQIQQKVASNQNNAATDFYDSELETQLNQDNHHGFTAYGYAIQSFSRNIKDLKKDLARSPIDTKKLRHRKELCQDAYEIILLFHDMKHRMKIDLLAFKPEKLSFNKTIGKPITAFFKDLFVLIGLEKAVNTSTNDTAYNVNVDDCISEYQKIVNQVEELLKKVTEKNVMTTFTPGFSAFNSAKAGKPIEGQTEPAQNAVPVTRKRKNAITN